jgi:hypothetical protein
MGEAQNMNGIADLLIAIEKSQSFKTAFLSSARKDEIKGKINFVVTFKRDS